MRIDHVIYAAADLDAAAARVQAALGVAAVPGGRHEGLGTHNAIVPLGGGYVELLAVADRAQAERSALGAAVLARLAGRGDGLMGWAVAVDAVEPVAARLGVDVTTIAREGLRARLAGVAEAMREPSLPFFIARDRDVGDPGAGGDAGGIAWVEVGGDAERLRAWLDGAALPVRVTGGTPGVRALAAGGRELRG
jgi:Glyoxalase-like domain